eukprot:m.160895 g.160895  ORF g.160895 m.160895 type:complete len:1140 (+) comp38791_c0_seq4:201-3620(+)
MACGSRDVENCALDWLRHQSLSKRDIRAVSDVLRALFHEEEPKPRRRRRLTGAKGVSKAGVVEQRKDRLHRWKIFASVLNVPTANVCAIEREESLENQCWELATLICQNQVGVVEAAQSAYLTGCKKVAYSILRLQAKTQHRKEDELEQFIRETFVYAGSPADVSYDKLYGVVYHRLPGGCHVKWKKILKKLHIEISSPCTPASVCQALSDWSLADGSSQGKMKELCDVLFDVGDYKAVHDLISGVCDSAPKRGKAGVARGLQLSLQFAGNQNPSQPGPKRFGGSSLLQVSHDRPNAENLERNEVSRDASPYDDATDRPQEKERSGKLLEVPELDKFLVGREDDVKSLLLKLKEERAVGLCGLAGMGKSSLAVSLAHSAKDEYESIAYINCSSAEGFETSVVKIGKKILSLRKLQKNLRGSFQSTFLESLETVKYWISSKKLLIFDGLNELSSEWPESLNHLVCKELPLNVHILFTSRKTLLKVGRLELSRQQRYYLQRLFETDVVDLLMKRSGTEPSGDEKEAARLIALEVGGIPQLVDLVASYIKQLDIPLRLYLTWIKAEGHLILEEGPESVQRIYEDTIDNAASSPVCKELLLMIACCDSPQLIPFDLFTIGAAGLAEIDCALKKELGISCSSSSRPVSTRLFTELLIRLQDFHLVHYNPKDERSKNSFWMHAEISRRVLKKAERDWQLKTEHGFRVLSSLLKATFKAFETDKAEVYESLISHASKCVKITEGSSDPYVALYFGRVASLLGRFHKAKSLLSDCKRRCQSDLDTDAKFKGLTLQYLGVVKRRLGELPKAEALISKAIEVWKGQGDVENLVLANIDYADVLTDAGEFKTAHEVLINLTDDDEVDSQETKYDAGNYYGSLGRACFGLNDHVAVKYWFRKATGVLKIKSEYKYTLYTAYCFIAKAKKLQGEKSDISTFRASWYKCRDITETLQSTHGLNHRFVAFAWRELAKLTLHFALLLSSDYDEDSVEEYTALALQLAFDSLKCHVTLFGHQHQKVAKSSVVIADVCLALVGKRTEKAATSCRKLALKLAIKNLEFIKCPKFLAVEEDIRTIKKELEAKVDYRKRFHDSSQKNAESSYDVTTCRRQRAQPTTFVSTPAPEIGLDPKSKITLDDLLIQIESYLDDFQ